MDETRLDLAQTPAHLFAYRAFRSVFVRSPESSPARAPSAPVLEDTATTPTFGLQSETRRPSRFPTSPVRPNHSGEDDIERRLTPKRQKMSGGGTGVSPSKSILRNRDGVITPRRVGLGGVNVTFRSVSDSGSPVRRKTNPPLCHAEPLVAATRGISENEKENLGASADRGVKLDLEAYKTQTEREMRRLMKYAGKWREKSKQVEEENERLKALVEHVQRENERLTRRLERVEQKTQEREMQGLEASATTSRLGRGQRRTAVLHAKVEDVLGAEPQRSAEKNRAGRESQPKPSTATVDDGDLDRSKAAAGESDVKNEKVPIERKRSMYCEEEQSLDPVERPSISGRSGRPREARTSLETPLERRATAPVRAASSSALTPGRAAAARARVAQRKALRAASLQAGVGTRGGKADASKVETDDSQVDWLAAA